MTSAAYVALGDSYAAGVGADHEQGNCFRSVGAYPLLVAADLGLPLEQRACIGATVSDVIDLQLDALGSQTRLVTISVGGNDIGFVKVLSACAAPAWMADGNAAIDAALAPMRGVLPGRLRDLYRRVRAAAPEAIVVATGYPRLFGDRDCNLLTFFSTQEIERLNAAADELAAIMLAAADDVGIVFVDPRASFEPHPLCSQQPWLHNLELVIERSFHPNPTGHEAYADLVVDAVADRDDLRRVEQPAAPMVREGPVGSRGHDIIGLPVITAPRALAAAAGFGLDPRRIEHLGRRHHRGAAEASAELHAIDHQLHHLLLERRHRSKH